MLAGERESAASRQALEQLCQSYWQPIYGFLRRKGFSPHDAEDLTQQFFVRLLKGDSMARADRSKGRFRTFLLGALQHFLTDELRKSTAQKRGGPNLPFAANFREAEERYLEEPDPNLTPEQMYDRRWAAGLLQIAFQSLSSEFESAGMRARFDRFKVLLASEPAEGEYERLAGELGMTRRAVSAAVYRMRQRYRQLVRGQVADTVAQSTEIDSELAQLFG
jgi:RNA polymerase sigma-70 factor (ECF subfamily)